MPNPGGSRSRNTGRRKADDDSAYIGASGIAKKRAAGERMEGLDRAKRKRVESSTALTANSLGSTLGTTTTATATTTTTTGFMRKGDSREPRPIYMDFSALPTVTLHRYLIAWDLVPEIQGYASSEMPPLPSALLPGGSTEDPTTTAANRPRRMMKDANKRRRSRTLEEDDEDEDARAMVMADVEGLHQVFAMIAERHFQQRPAGKEVDVLSNFLQAASRSRGG